MDVKVSAGCFCYMDTDWQAGTSVARPFCRWAVLFSQATGGGVQENERHDEVFASFLLISVREAQLPLRCSTSVLV